MTMPTIDTLICNAYIITIDEHRRVFTNGYLAISDGRISAIGSMRDCPAPVNADGRRVEVIDAGGRLLMPGMVNGHNHLIQNSFRGYNDDRWPVLDIPAAVRRLIEQLFALSGRLDDERTYALVRLHALEMLKLGYTATHDEHFTNVRKDSVDGSWQALADSGMRGYLCRCIVDGAGVPVEGHEAIDDGLAEVERLKAKFDGERIRVATGFLNFNFVSDPEHMRRIHQGARALGVAFDVDMTDNSRGAVLAQRGFEHGQVRYYESFGLLDEPIYAGKAVQVRPDEFDLLKAYDCRLALVPALRFFDAVGLPIHEFFSRDMIPGLGTDAPLVSDCQSPFETMRLAIFAQNLAVKNSVAAGGERPDAAHWAVAERTLEMATLGGARTLFIDDVSGSLQVGKAADCVLVDTQRSDFAPDHAGRRKVGSLVWAGHAGMVDSVWIAGERLIEGGKSTRWDEETVVAEAEAVLADIDREVDLGRFLSPRQAGSSFRGWNYV